MRRIIPGFFSLTCLLFSCSEVTNDAPTTSEAETEQKKEFVMYEQSEMAALMLHMYQVNEQLKNRILEGEDIGDFSASFERILSAKQTDNKAMDDFFKSHAETFLKLQKSIYDNPETAKDQFNAAVDACIACHQVKCPGPIQKIEKLYIEKS